MQKAEKGFDYYLTKERIQSFKEKPPKLRLAWLYFGNLLRKQYPERIIKLQDELRMKKK
ncbi:MAG: hypothetical protein V2A53_10775 [bacterium]